MKWLDDFLNQITMYRLLLYCLIALLLAAFGLSLADVLPYPPLAMLATTGVALLVCWLSNWLLSVIFNVPANIESNYLTALILALIITPKLSLEQLLFVAMASIFAMASKFLVTYRNKHLFNPTALAVVITALFANQAASWWVGTASLLPIVVIIGILIIRKIHRFDLALSFFLTALATVLVIGSLHGTAPLSVVKEITLYSPLFFFGFIMLTEPMTTPPRLAGQVMYGALTGFLFAPQLHLGSTFSTPELALILGNVFAWIISPKWHSKMTLVKKELVAENTYDFIFKPDQPLSFLAGQYVDWTIPVTNIDSRGNRRSFTIASSPTEELVRFGVKFYQPASSFKRELLTYTSGENVWASQLSGNFTLPNDANQKLAFIAGGIGVTPFRSIAKYLTDTNQKRDAVLFYSNKTPQEICYQDVFQAASATGLRTIYTVTDEVSETWQGKRGLIDKTMIETEIPDYKERLFYLSGPHGMVVAFEHLLKQMGVPSKQIKKDYFPGYA